MTADREALPRRWTCVGVTDEAHPFCLFVTDNEQWAAEHRDHPGHWCLSEDEPHIEPRDARAAEVSGHA